MTLKLNGYSTAQFGKCHEVPPWQTSPVGPFDSWPSGGGGFEHFYGFIGGENNQYYPALYDGTTPVEPEKTPEEGYHLTEDLTDQAIDWIRTQKALAPEKPFFVYFAPGATHAPHHVPLEWADKYAGQFAGGWDAQREAIIARQKQLGVVPQDAELTARPEVIPAWDDMDETLKPVLERQMEIYAGFLEHTDYHVGRLIDTVENHRGTGQHAGLLHHRRQRGLRRGHGQRRVQRDGELQRHGRDRDPGIHGLGQGQARHGGRLQPLRRGLGVGDVHPLPVDQAGRLALGWHPQRHHRALAGRDQQQGRSAVPVLPRDRRRPNDSGGRGTAGAGLRQRGAAVADRGHQHGLQLRGTRRPGAARPAVLRDGRQPRHLFQGLERGHPAQHPWLPAEVLPALDDDVWELYDGDTDWSQARDLAAEQPDRLAKLQRLWLIEAVKYNVLPIDDRRFERLNATIAGRPQLITGTSQVLFPGMKRLSEGSVIDIKNRSFSVTASIDAPADGPANGVIIAQGGKFGGWALYFKQGRAKFVYNVLGMQEFVTEATEELTPGSHQVRAEFAYDGGGLAKGGTVTLYYDGAASAPAGSDVTQPLIFSADETTDIGNDYGMPVSTDYAGASRFNGRIDVVQIDVGDDDQSHLIDPEQVAMVAISRQ